jgi:UDP-galactopyranose mutase
MSAHDLVCISHLRWKFVFQRPQHLMTRFGRERRVFFVEEPVHHDGDAELYMDEVAPGVRVAVPRLPHGVDPKKAAILQRTLLDGMFDEHEIERPVMWFYTPMGLPFAGHVEASAVVYDCMDELSAFLGAPPELLAFERELLSRADLVFTGGHSLYEAKRDRHPSVHAFPSSVDAAHFAIARNGVGHPADCADLPRPRIGYYGVVDERIDYDLIARIADARPAWSFVMVGPVVKVDPAKLPQRPNLHWLGGRPYEDLPKYLASWDVAIMPFALNEATRFISPTKTLEYLAGGKPVVSTPIRDVVRPYGEQGLVEIAQDPASFVAAIERALQTPHRVCCERGDTVVARTSWDRTHAKMAELIAYVCNVHGAPTRRRQEGASCTTT